MIKQWPTLHEEESQLAKKRQQLWQNQRNSPTDDTWVPLSSWLLEGIHHYKNPTSDSDLLMFVQGDDQQPSPPPPETFYTNQQAIAEINSILARDGLTHQHLDALIQEYRQAMAEGLISAEEWEKCAAELEKIRTLHVERLNKIVTWFKENFYRVFEEKLPVVTKVKLTGARMWSNISREQELGDILAMPYTPSPKRYRR